MVYSVILYHTLLCYGSTIFCYGSHILYHGSTIFYHGSTSISWLNFRGQLNPGGNSRVLPLVSRHPWHCCLDSEPWHCWTNELVCSGYRGWPGLHWAQWWAWLAGKVHVQAMKYICMRCEKKKKIHQKLMFPPSLPPSLPNSLNLPPSSLSSAFIPPSLLLSGPLSLLWGLPHLLWLLWEGSLKSERGEANLYWANLNLKPFHEEKWPISCHW